MAELRSNAHLLSALGREERGELPSAFKWEMIKELDLPTNIAYILREKTFHTRKLQCDCYVRERETYG